ncbi:high affinity methionine permease [Cordyceps fumosorosea ARSEF 2679]|uniref:High affinity methionine permease n=1 Tax=Cordyceps fumosorosea (strain ARSEF 2679) TaxID=1081104 RepID=A0A162J307_CORFA|nr:high affinity methionine permease [Cordyceps fumosorosea ARSEF 2679]OAA63062.1 high affinity methionine permease [Cordyceps fumosorosea ARSEF 2679]
MATYPSEKQNTSDDGAEAQASHHGAAVLDDGVGNLTFDQYTTGGMGRHLGITSTTFLIVGRIIGTGIFSTPSAIVAGVGSVGASLLLWVLGLLLSVCGLCVWLELACMIPRSGGEKVYLEAAYRRPRMLITTVFAVQAVALGFTGMPTPFPNPNPNPNPHTSSNVMIASGCIIFASNILVAAGRVATEWEKRGIAIAVIVAVTLVHTFFPKVGVHGMNFFTVLKVALLLFIVVTGWVVLGGGVAGVADPHASFRDAFADSARSGNPYATALFKVLNSYAGWSNAMYVLNEVKDPVRTIKIAGPLGLSICGVLYLLANVAYFAAATPAEVAASGTTVAAYFMGKVFGLAAKRALSVLVALSALGNVMTVTFAQARVNQELAKEGVIPFPRFWASNWPLGSPSAGLILHFIPSFIVIVAIPFGNAYNFILDLEGYPGSVINFLVVTGLFLLRRSEPDAPRPFRVWWPVAGFFMLGQAFQLVAPFLRPPGGKGDTPPLPYWLYCVVGIAILVASVVYWFVCWVAAPRIGKYELVPENEPLADGTNVVVYHRVPREFQDS